MFIFTLMQSRTHVDIRQRSDTSAMF